ncbi:excisionase [Cellvibrio zantedeschiae]|uniref:Excisionase n=1 Tax=Cellvibrio zantedeschiae TaxID=1237077 RepID=A0ABQ3ALX7_9GAMM|nr:helix-turn-helix domain-containing protein [Cellvibrio zantedeschiae]GGY61492.1 excisionase [Cellvibrio zantedeschiae]
MNARHNIVHLPTKPEMEEAKLSSRMLSKYADADRVQMSLRGSNGTAEDLVLPGPVLQLLLDILSEMAKGNAISLVPIHHELSTQEAANLLNVSRPHLVSLLEKNELPFRKVGAHRRVLAKDVLEYKEKIDSQRSQALDELTALSQSLGMGYES